MRKHDLRYRIIKCPNQLGYLKCYSFLDHKIHRQTLKEGVIEMRISETF